MKIPAIIKHANSITVLVDGFPFAVSSDDRRYNTLSEAIINQDWDAVSDLAKAPSYIEEAVAEFGAVAVYGGHVTIEGAPANNYLVDKILEAKESGFPIAPLANFLDKVKQNPSFRAVEGLFAWCEKSGLPIMEDGRITAWKIVNDDFTDCYTRKFDNSPGKVVKVPRNQVDENPERTCSYGLHFCSSEYLPHYGPANKKVVLVAVNPRDVVAFPNDYNLSKARCCEYEVLQEIEDPSSFFKGHKGFFTPKYFVIIDSDGDFIETTTDCVDIYDYTSDFSDAAEYTQGEAEEILKAVRSPDWKMVATEDVRFYVVDRDGDYLTDTFECTTRAGAQKFTYEQALEIQSQWMIPCDLRTANVGPRKFVLYNPRIGYWLEPGNGYTDMLHEAYVYDDLTKPVFTRDDDVEIEV